MIPTMQPAPSNVNPKLRNKRLPEKIAENIVSIQVIFSRVCEKMRGELAIMMQQANADQPRSRALNRVLSRN